MGVVTIYELISSVISAPIFEVSLAGLTVVLGVLLTIFTVKLSEVVKGGMLEQPFSILILAIAVYVIKVMYEEFSVLGLYKMPSTALFRIFDVAYIALFIFAIHSTINILSGKKL